MKNKNVKNLVHLLENTNHIWSSGVCVLDRDLEVPKLCTFTYGIRVETYVIRVETRVETSHLLKGLCAYKT